MSDANQLFKAHCHEYDGQENDEATLRVLTYGKQSPMK